MPQPNAKEAEVERFCEDLQDLPELTSKRDVLFIIGDWNAKVGSRNTSSNRQIWPWSIKQSRSKANRVLPREHTGHSKHPLPPTQEKTLHMESQMVNTEIRLIIFFAAKDGKLYTVSQNETRSWLWLWSWAAYCQIQTEIEESRENP